MLAPPKSLTKIKTDFRSLWRHLSLNNGLAVISHYSQICHPCFHSNSFLPLLFFQRQTKSVSLNRASSSSSVIPHQHRNLICNFACKELSVTPAHKLQPSEKSSLFRLVKRVKTFQHGFLRERTLIR